MKLNIKVFFELFFLCASSLRLFFGAFQIKLVQNRWKSTLYTIKAYRRQRSRSSTAATWCKSRVQKLWSFRRSQSSIIASFTFLLYFFFFLFYLQYIVLKLHSKKFDRRFKPKKKKGEARSSFCRRVLCEEKVYSIP